MTGYVPRRYGTNASRYWWGIAFRKMLVNSGQYKNQ